MKELTPLSPEILLTSDVSIEDVFTGEKIELKNGKAALDMKRHETRIFWRIKM